MNWVLELGTVQIQSHTSIIISLGWAPNMIRQILKLLLAPVENVALVLLSICTATGSNSIHSAVERFTSVSRHSEALIWISLDFHFISYRLQFYSICKLKQTDELRNGVVFWKSDQVYHCSEFECILHLYDAASHVFCIHDEFHVGAMAIAG